MHTNFVTLEIPAPPTPLPYSRPCVDEDDIAAVVAALRSPMLTTGPRVAEFEAAFAHTVGAHHAVAVSSGTAALHAALHAIRLKPGDEVILPTMTFAATASAVVFVGGRPVFADVDPDTLLLDPAQVAARISPRTRAIIAVDYAGQPCEYDALQELANRHGLTLIADACHALGGLYQDRPVGSLARLSAFSFHPVKHITTAEGGIITTDDHALAEHMRRFRNHGMTRDAAERQLEDTWYYEIPELGCNYRLSDIQCALGLSQLNKLSNWIARRQQLARQYAAGLLELHAVRPLHVRPEVSHAFHLYVVRIDPAATPVSRTTAFTALRAAGIGVNVHYIPVHLHPFYRRHFRTRPGDCPVAEAAYEQMLSLPMYPTLDDDDVQRVIDTLRHVLEG